MVQDLQHSIYSNKGEVNYCVLINYEKNNKTNMYMQRETSTDLDMLARKASLDSSGDLLAGLFITRLTDSESGLPVTKCTGYYNIVD